MCNRSEIVSNGCSGNCCEKFTLPVKMEDLYKMKEELIAAKQEDRIHNKLVMSNGYERFPVYEEELDKLIDMLIPLGTSAYNPQSGNIWNVVLEYDPTLYSLEDVHSHTHGHYLIQNEQILGMIYTCKYFDKENRICTNYDNRPDLCKSFGDNCKYQGCGFTEKLKEKEEQARIEWAKKNPELVLEESECKEA